jgi:uncharacterized protein YggE
MSTTERNIIGVTGHGSANAAPDRMRLLIGVSVVRDSVAAATSDARRLATAVTAAIRTAGVGERDTQTTRFSIHPEYRHTERRRVLDGYRVTSTVTATIRDLERPGEVIDAAVAAGGNEVVVDDVSFDVEDESAARRRARERAWRDAEDRAQQLAALAGVGLGSPTRIDERTTPLGGPMPMARAAAMAEAAPTPIEVGTQTITVTIDVEFAIVPS